jgi:GGDEF domain-containing protein
MVSSLIEIAHFDTDGRDVACRYEGDKKLSFAIYAKYAPQTPLEAKAHAACEAINARFEVKRSVSISVGVAKLDKPTPHAEDLENVAAESIVISSSGR